MLTFQGSTWLKYTFRQIVCQSVPPEERGWGVRTAYWGVDIPGLFFTPLARSFPNCLPAGPASEWAGSKGSSGSGSCARSNGQLYLP